MSALEDTNYTNATQSGNNIADELISIHSDFQTWQRTKVLDLSPVIVLDVIYMLFGVVGNSVVCYICMCRMQHTVINSCILSLAILELLGCIFMIPVDITEILNAYVFDFPILCKSEKYFTKFIIFSTGCILVAIATERYKLIVKPHGRHMTLCQFRIAITAAVVFSAILAVPDAILAGSETVQTAFGYGVVCSTYHSDQYRFSVFPKLWGMIVSVIYFLSIVSITTIYCLIASKLWKREKVHTDRRSIPNTPDSTLQRRTRCHSFQEKRSHEHVEGKVGASLSFLDSLRSTYPDPGSINNSSHLSLTEPKDVIIPENILMINQYQELDQHHIDFDIGNSFRKQNNEKYHSLKKQITKMKRNKDSDIGHYMNNDSNVSHFQICNEQYRGEDDISSSHLLIPNGQCPNKKDCSENVFSFNSKVQRYLANNRNEHANENMKKSYQNEVTQSTLFLNSFLTKNNERKHESFLQRRHSHNPDNSHPILRELKSIGSLHRKSRYSRKRTTFIMFIITLTSILSHLPHIVVMLYSLVQPGVTVHLLADESVIFNVAWNSFFISLATHPFMYGFWNGRFNDALCLLFKGLKQDKIKIDNNSGSSVRQK